eukprot:SAG31_NODE_2140_length_6350_cov_2.239962_5_plen_129_part_00
MCKASTLAGARFQLDGKEYKLSPNIMDQHHGHGGFTGFDKVIWDAEVLAPSSSTPSSQADHPQSPTAASAASVRFRYLSVDGEEGYPGTMQVELTYTVTAHSNELWLDYRAVVDKPCPVNLTIHSYRS